MRKALSIRISRRVALILGVWLCASQIAQVTLADDELEPQAQLRTQLSDNDKAAFSYNAKLLAVARSRHLAPGGFANYTDSGSFEIWDVSKQEALLIKKLGKTAKGNFIGSVDVSFHPDNKRLAISLEGGDFDDPYFAILIWDAVNSQEIETITNGWKGFFSPNGKYLAVTGPAQPFTLCDTVHWKPIVNMAMVDANSSPSDYGSPVFSPSGKYLAAAFKNQKLVIWETSSGKIVNEIAEGSVVSGEHGWKSDERVVLVTRSGWKIWDWRNSKEIESHEFKRTSSNGLRICSANGKVANRFSVAGGLIRSGYDEIDILDGTNRMKCYGKAFTVGNLLFSPNGNHLAARSGEDVVIWRLK